MFETQDNNQYDQQERIELATAACLPDITVDFFFFARELVAVWAEQFVERFGGGSNQVAV